METLALYAVKGGDGGGGGTGDVTGVKGSAESTYRKGNVSISAANIGLGNVNNTADADKPISTATQTALDDKVDKVTGKGLSTNDYTDADKSIVDGITEALNNKISKSATVGLVKNDGTIDTDVKQNQTLSSAITIDGVNYTSVESTLGALSDAVGAMTDAQWTQVQAILN